MSDEQTPTQDGSGGTEYVVRPFRSQDSTDVLSLYRTVWGADRDQRWFDWKYDANPYLDGPPMIVASTGQEVVGARPFYPFPIATGSTEMTGIYCGDLMVHPDHRRQGLFTRMTDRAMQSDISGAFMFNFGNELSTPGFKKLGWQPVGTGPRRVFRIQWPSPQLQPRLGERLGLVAGALTTPVVRTYLRSRSLVRRSVDHSLTREQQLGIPAEQLEALYDCNRPQQLHTRREPRLYRWLSANPVWQYETYLASRDGTPRAALVVRSRSDTESSMLQVVDALPPVTSSRESAFTALLQTLVEDRRDRSAIEIKGPVIHERLFQRGLLSTFGFHSTSSPPLSLVAAKNNTMFVCPHDRTESTVDGVDLTDPDDWLVRAH
ncbi:MAG: GNAT family N-acetyltransferase [Halorientalis sp.]